VNHDQIEFIRSGSISFDLVRQEFGTEKGVDTRMTADMITLSDIYDIAIIVSGDADYILAAQVIKRKGKLAYSVSFLNESGRKLPGVARRLEGIVDGKKEIPFEQIRAMMNVTVTD
jgi:uncharacterized LabA/DUF88 family protein